MDGQTKRVNKVLKDMLRMYVMDKPSKWEDYIHLVEFAYNNNFQVFVGMSSPIDILMLGTDLLRDMELIVKQVQQNLKVSQDK